LNDFASDEYSIVFKQKYVLLLNKFLTKKEIVTAIKNELKEFLQDLNLNNCKLLIYVLFLIYKNFDHQKD
jgi:hypothetical protein